MALPTIESFFLEIPLYEKFPFTEADGNYIYVLKFFSGKVDAYCPFCEKSSTFRGNQSQPSPGGFQVANYSELKQRGGVGLSGWINKIFPINLICTRNESHLMQIIIYLTENEFFKIGQFPSIADLSMPDLRKYRDVLSSEKYKELNRGIGLITHGVGVGAFVYLRRIFEDLIEEARIEHSKLAEWDEDTYQRSRMDDKIEILKSSLPDFLTENRKLYGILSKGIHELTENECLEYFPTVKLGVELILDEKLEHKRRKNKIEAAKKSLGKIQSDLKKE